MASNFFSTFNLSFNYPQTDLIMPLPCSKTFQISLMCTESNPDSLVWYYQDSKMPCYIPYSFYIPDAPCRLHSLNPTYVYFQSLSAHDLLPFCLHWPFKFQLRGQLLEKVLLDLPHSESEPITPGLFLKPLITPLEHLSICCF